MSEYLYYRILLENQLHYNLFVDTGAKLHPIVTRFIKEFLNVSCFLAKQASLEMEISLKRNFC
jgi:hypothetical protein